MVERERRSEDRLPERLRALFVLELGDTETYIGQVIDLSEGGVCLQTEHPIGLGTEVYVGMFMLQHAYPLVVHARVVWERHDGEGARHGLEFVGVGRAQQEALERLGEYLYQRRLQLSTGLLR